MRSFLGLAVLVLLVTFSGTAIAADGAGIFKKKCSSCHGKGAVGSKMAPALAGNDFIKNNDEALILKTIQDGRKGKAKKYKKFPIPMPSWKKKLKEDEIKSIIGYLKGL